MGQRRPKILVVGGCYVDMAIKCDEFPGSGQSVPGIGFSSKIAGGGANQSIVAANCDCDVVLVGKVGSEQLGKYFCETLSAQGVDVGLVELANAKSTGVYVTFVNSLGENMGCVSAGANLALQAERIKSVAVEQAIIESDVCLIDGTLPQDVVEAALRIAELNGKPSILSVEIKFDRAKGSIENLPVSYMLAHALIPEFKNQSSPEEGIFTNAQDFKMAGANLISQGFPFVVINTCKKGCFIFDRNGVEHVESFDVEMLDQSCCKDAFAGALAASMATNDSILQSVKFAYAAACIAGSRFGGPDSLPKKDEIINLLMEQSD